MRPKNIVKPESFSITVTHTTYGQLEQLCACGYGTTVSDAAAEIVSAEVRRLIVSGELDKLLAKRPVAPKSDQEYPGREGSVEA
jgi:hypothetical protein